MSSPRHSRSGPSALFGSISARWQGKSYATELGQTWERELLQALKDDIAEMQLQLKRASEYREKENAEFQQ